MGLTLAAQIPDGAQVLVDTNPIIYVLEGHRLAAAFAPVFAAVEAGRLRAVVTPITPAPSTATRMSASRIVQPTV